MWLIVGAKGQLGKCLADELAMQNTAFQSSTHQELDITNADQVDEFLSREKFTNIVNCAAWTAVDDAEDHIADAMRVNFEGPQNLACAALKYQSRLIHISTDYVFKGDADTPYEVDTPTDPLNAYGRTKQMGDSAVQIIGEGMFPIIRTAWLYSKYGKNFAKTMMSRAIQELPVNVVDDQIGQPTLANDLAKLIIDVAALKVTPKIIHGTNSGTATWYEFAKSIYQLIGADPALVSPVGTEQFPTKASRPKYSVLGHEDFRRVGLLEMRDWKVALNSEITNIKNEVQAAMK